jgi:hypothetical protein
MDISICSKVITKCLEMIASYFRVVFSSDEGKWKKRGWMDLGEFSAIVIMGFFFLKICKEDIRYCRLLMLDDRHRVLIVSVFF